MRAVGISFFAAVAMAGCAQLPSQMPTGNTNVSLAPGMTRAQVVTALGSPSSFIAERSGVECLIYVEKRPLSGIGGFTQLNFGREHVVILRDGALIQHQHLDTGLGSVAPTADTVTSAKVCKETADRVKLSGTAEAAKKRSACYLRMKVVDAASLITA